MTVLLYFKIFSCPEHNFYGKKKEENHLLIYFNIKDNFLKNKWKVTSLVVQWLRHHAPNAGGPGSIPGQGTRSRMPQLRARMPQPKIQQVATKDPACDNEDPK